MTLPHEHLFIDLLREYRGNGLLNDEALAIEEVGAFQAAGGGTIVDCTSEGSAGTHRRCAACPRRPA